MAKYVVETNKPAVKAREEWLLQKESSAPGRREKGDRPRELRGALDVRHPLASLIRLSKGR
jgi:hypothetical protein